MINIEKNIPIKTVKGLTAEFDGRTEHTKFIREMVANMEVGDSVTYRVNNLSTFSSNLTHIPKRAGLKVRFAMRNIGGNEYRIWRVA